MRPIFLTAILLLGMSPLTLDASEENICERMRDHQMERELTAEQQARIEEHYTACVEREAAREEALRARMEARGIDYDAVERANRREEPSY